MTMSIRREIKYVGFDGTWYMDIMWDNTIEVKFEPEVEYGPGEPNPREYDIPEDITGIEHSTEYVHLTLNDKRVIQFKFEINGVFIGDILGADGEFLDTFARYSFWDDDSNITMEHHAGGVF